MKPRVSQLKTHRLKYKQYKIMKQNYAREFPGGSVVKNSPLKAGDRFDPWVRRIPWRKKWLPTPGFLPGKSHGQRRLVGYSSGVTKSPIWLSIHAHMLGITFVTFHPISAWNSIVNKIHLPVIKTEIILDNVSRNYCQWEDGKTQ